jgi:hypothetical protein
LVANPFGQKAFTKGPASRMEVKPGESLRLRFGVWVYSAAPDMPADHSNVARHYEQLPE